MDCCFNAEVLALCPQYRPLKLFVSQLALGTAAQQARGVGTRRLGCGQPALLAGLLLPSSMLKVPPLLTPTPAPAYCNRSL